MFGCFFRSDWFVFGASVDLANQGKSARWPQISQGRTLPKGMGSTEIKVHYTCSRGLLWTEFLDETELPDKLAEARSNNENEGALAISEALQAFVRRLQSSFAARLNSVDS